MDSSGDKPQESPQDIVAALQEKVNSLYLYRDHYFETHKIDDAIHKNGDVEKKLSEILGVFNECEKRASGGDRAKFCFLKGRALNVVPKFSKEAESLLSKAVKLDPKCVEAWNELGECFWKNNELKKAMNCFEGALKERKNKVSLRNLSMLARQETSSSRENLINNIEKGLNYAKEAVQLDPQDGLSWAVLGNAHLSSFFGIQQNPKTLKQCLSAYSQAEKDIVAKSTPDLHYNKGITLKYEEEFELALESFNKAALYDPTWDQPKIKEKQLVRYLNEITDLVTTSGKMKAKRLQQILQSIDSKQLGPYAGGSYTSSANQTVKLDEIPLGGLKPGLNEEKVVLGKVVCSVQNEDSVPFTFCLVDKLGTCVVVTVFNLADGKGVIIGNSVAIPEPYVTDVDFTYKDNEYKFRLIRVETPLVMVVNGKKVNRDLQAGVQMSIFNKYD
ncbi:tetratricopeptide repeat protein 5 [Tribolium castaneum]|uniref:Cell division cycle protein 27 homolog n=1 Tax=Tribolium castaneum TaxID=7070 RepID=D1ZZR8_TRICA|nr:PREDICTED: tetratricopeptide repeat protein 5 [Tribolium castaneum]EFA01806.1 Tetratricopeptide repeat protein 5-like Protein [Tribolium castaneum]|eukprot:XP_974732.3 PREDICTED: tetratricopeptide repeat protein 5 [Tribolium castaneum]